MKHQSQCLRSRTDIIYKTDKSDQGQSQYKPRIFKLIRQEKGQCTQIEDDSSTSQSNPGMRTPLVWFVNNITFISNTEIKKFCQE